MRQRTGLVVCLAMTLGCAAIFLGVKAVEYTHKWELGLYTAGYYVPQYTHAGEHHAGISQWLIFLSIVPGLAAVGFLIWYLVATVKKDKRTAEVAGPFLVTALCYFVGVGMGLVIENTTKKNHGDEHAVVAGETTEERAASQEHAATPAEIKAEAAAVASPDAHNQPAEPHQHVEAHSVAAADFEPGEATDMEVDQKGRAGLFFSIYYCMTGVHALHILGGIVVLGWLLIRATKNHFNEEYFGPVDYVGLYWHLVDLIWIYLFPLLYLIK
jgi:cytochrome c oxidase subunit 3